MNNVFCKRLKANFITLVINFVKSVPNILVINWHMGDVLRGLPQGVILCMCTPVHMEQKEVMPQGTPLSRGLLAILAEISKEEGHGFHLFT